MKLQYLAVIFVIIMLPISLVLSFYIQSQIDIVNMQTLYKTKLNDATYDAVKAFQLNTTNSYYSGVSEAKIRDIEASINTFYNAFTSSTNYTKEEIRSCVPAMVYTLYDGYYIYGKRYNVYKNNIPNDKGELESVTIETDTDEKPEYYEYGLRPYSYYSCRYKIDSNNDVVINYTLDNFISVYGTINGEYVTESGYLIKKGAWVGDKYNDVTIGTKETLKEYLIINKTPEGIDIKSGNYQYVVYQSQKVYRTAKNGHYFWYNDGEAKIINDANMKNKIAEQMDTSKKNSATKYYEEANEFTNWFYTGNKDGIGFNGIGSKITQGNVVLPDSSIDLDFKAENEIFKSSEDPEDPSSTFNQHRMAVIRRSIESNLLTAINSYNSNAGSYAFALPKLNADEWQKITNNVCIISFMQGLELKGKYFNSYAVVPNDKNNEFVDTDSIYLITSDGKYHMPNCPLLVKNDTGVLNNETIGYVNTSFERQTLRGRTDENGHTDDTKYYYKHVKSVKLNGEPLEYYTACYHCIVSPSGEYELDEILSGTISTDSKLYPYRNSISTLRSKYLTALAREKYDLYKTNN